MEEERYTLYNKTLQESIGDEVEKAYRSGKKAGILEGEKDAIKKIAIGALGIVGAATIVTAGLSIGTTNSVAVPPYNDAYTYFLHNSHNYHPVDLAKNYNPDGSDEYLDIFLYGCWNGLIDQTPEDRLERMNSIVAILYYEGQVEFNNFYEYCKSRGLTKIVDGKEVIDTEKYEKALKDFYKDVQKKYKFRNKEKEIEEKIDDFLDGKSGEIKI